MIVVVAGPSGITEVVMPYATIVMPVGGRSYLVYRCNEYGEDYVWDHPRTGVRLDARWFLTMEIARAWVAEDITRRGVWDQVPR